MHDEDPSNWPSGRRYTYSKGTSTSSLRPHIEKYHLDEYKKLAIERGWKILIPGVLAQIQSQSSGATTMQEGQPDKFDQPTFQKYLLNFVVANDQVMIFISFLCLGVTPHTVPHSFEMFFIFSP